MEKEYPIGKVRKVGESTMATYYIDSLRGTGGIRHLLDYSKRSGSANSTQ